MKKYAFLLCAILALGACQTQIEEVVPDNLETTVLTATIQTGADTRTSLSPLEDGLSSVLWSENDVIGVSVDGVDDFSTFGLIGGEGSKKGSFSGPGRGSSYVAFYPASGAKSLVGDKVGVVLPEEQEYADGSFGQGSFPMVAVSRSTDLQFKAVASVVRLSVKGHQFVTRIVFRSNSPDIKVSGPATVDLSDLSAPRLEVSAEGADSLVMNTGSVLLDDDIATDFYLVLPAQTYKGGFTVRIYTTNGFMDKSLRSDFTMERGVIHPADAFTVELTNGIDSSPSLSGAGTENDPFLVSSLEDLILVQERVDVDGVIRTEDGLDIIAATASYLLTSDLDLSPLCSPASGKSWTPIGISESGRNARQWLFKGTFDGGGHEISNLYIEDPGGTDIGFFGSIDNATVRNLTVSGEVISMSYVGILCGSAEKSLIENCTVKGRVESTGAHAGGIMGIAGSTCLSYCRNEAEIIGYTYAGGIIGNCNTMVYVEDCTNAGTVSGSIYIGGIAGYDSASKVIDCVNLGQVRGGTRAGGVAGYLYQGGKVFNSINYGEVSGEDFIGGIGGFVSSQAMAYFGAGTIANSINLGRVSVSGGTHVGWLASYAGLEDDEEPLEGEPIDAAWVKNSYWLKGADEGIKGVGGGPGIVENVFALTEAQMKGAAFDGTLYTVSRTGVGFDRLIDALNAGAVEWSKNLDNKKGGDRATNYHLAGWEYVSSGSYPSLSDLDAQIPGTEKPVLSVSGNAFEFDVKGGQFKLEVTASGDYSFAEIPVWVREVSVQTHDQKPHTHIHTFKVLANSTGDARKAVFEVYDAAGTKLRVRVAQKAPYLEISSTECAMAGVDGSKRIVVSSSLDWKVTTEDTWFTVSPKKGSGDGAVSIVVPANKKTEAREGSVTISSEDGSFSHVVSVIQSGYVGEDVGNWEELPFYHQSVVFRFTATWCVWCPYMYASVKRAQELYPGKIQHLALHSGGSDLQFDLASTLMSSFRSNAFPTGIVDGRIQVQNSDDIEAVAPGFVSAAKETEEVYGTASGMAISSTSSGQMVSINVDAYFKTAGKYKITVLLIEDDIVHEQTNGGPDYVHNDVVRACATNILGDAFTVSRDLSKKSFKYTVSVPSEDKLENMSVFAYIQREFGSAPRIQSEDYGDYYVDNCATVAVGETLKLALVGDDGGGSGGGNEEIIPGDEIK